MTYSQQIRHCLTVLKTDANDSESWERLSKLLRYCIGKKFPVLSEDVEDVIQQTLLAIWQKLPTLDVEPTAVSVWVTRTANNLASKFVRGLVNTKGGRFSADFIDEDIYPSADPATPPARCLECKEILDMCDFLITPSWESRLGRFPAQVLKGVVEDYFSDVPTEKTAKRLDFHVTTTREYRQKLIDSLKPTRELRELIHG